VDELVKALTSLKFKDKILVVLAGYDADMDSMLKTNRGLQSRFTGRLHFPDLEPSAAVELLQLRMSQKNLHLAADMKTEFGAQKLLALAQSLAASKEYANGRDVESWAAGVYREIATRTAGATTAVVNFEVTLEDFRRALDKLLSGREMRTGSTAQTGAPERHQQNAGALFPRPSTTRLATAIETTSEKKDNVAEDAEVVVELAEVKEVAEVAFEGSSSSKAFGEIDRRVLQTLQDLMTEEGLDTAEGALRLRNLQPGEADFERLVQRLMAATGLDASSATAQLCKWQDAHKHLEEELEREQQMLKGKKATMEPIWRCAVCGRADKPYIACYVAPYIVSYRSISK
jgi:hypothetical protein